MTSRLEKKLEACLDEGNYYEAHQIYRTLYYRMTTSQKFAELATLLFNGALRLVKGNEFSSAIDLAELFAEVLLKAAAPVEEGAIQRIGELTAALPSQLPSDAEVHNTADRRNPFISSCVKWSQAVSTRTGDKRRGAPELHHVFAKVFWAEENYEQARQHFLIANQPEEFARFLIELHQKHGTPSEVDLFVAQAVLQLLCLGASGQRTAAALLPIYCKQHPEIATDPPTQKFPLVNFLHLLVQAVPKRNLQYYTILVEKYQPSIARDCHFRGYLDRIGQKYFGLPPPQSAPQFGGLFGNLLKGLTGGADAGKKQADDSDSDVEMTDGMDVDEDGYLTADEDKEAVSKKPAGMVDNYDDLD